MRGSASPRFCRVNGERPPLSHSKDTRGIDYPLLDSLNLLLLLTAITVRLRFPLAEHQTHDEAGAEGPER